MVDQPHSMENIPDLPSTELSVALLLILLLLCIVFIGYCAYRAADGRPFLQILRYQDEERKRRRRSQTKAVLRGVALVLGVFLGAAALGAFGVFVLHVG